MDKRLQGYVLVIAGFLLIAYSFFSFVNGNGDKENLAQVMITMLGGAIAFFAGIHFTVPKQNEDKPIPSKLPENRN